MKKITYHILLVGAASLLTAQAQTPAVTAGGETTPPPAVVATEPAPPPGATVVTNDTVTPPAAGAETNAPATPTTPGSAASIPLIQFADVPITTAIENLCRQAGINYLLDPKINYGQTDEKGQVRLEPTLSIRWENISAENALFALLDNYGLQFTHDKKTGIGRIGPKDPLAPPPLITRVMQLKYASVSNITEAVQSVLTDKRSKVLADTRTSQVVVVATDPEQLAVDTLVAQLDKPTKQVLIETRLIEISSNPKTKKGVDWTQTLAGNNIYFGNGLIDASKSSTVVSSPGTTTGTPTPGGGYTPTPGSSASTVLNLVQGAGGFSGSTASGLIPATGFLNSDGLHAVLSFINSSADAQIVSTPRVVTLDNQQAKISVTRGYPVFNVQAGTQNSAGGSQVTYSNVGPVLLVTPRISANDHIELKVDTSVDSYFGQFSQTLAGGQGGSPITLTAPLFDMRNITTKVVIPNANTLVMGGLVQDKPQANYTKVPLLGDIPFVGYAFRSEEKSLDKQNLLIFITPTIVKDSDFQSSITGDFLQSNPNTMKSPMNPNNSWDSAKPRGNWSNPVPNPGEFDTK